jgi:hypothetical protein
VFHPQLDTDLTRATGAADLKDDFISKLSRVVQLTGPSSLFRLSI